MDGRHPHDAFWLIDVVASYWPQIRRMNADFVVWRVRSDGSDKGVFVEAWSDTPNDERSDDGEQSALLVIQQIEYSSFPRELLPYKFWQEGEVVLIPEEH